MPCKRGLLGPATLSAKAYQSRWKSGLRLRNSQAHSLLVSRSSAVFRICGERWIVAVIGPCPASSKAFVTGFPGRLPKDRHSDA